MTGSGPERARDPDGGLTVERLRSESSGRVGRAVTSGRGPRLVLDSPGHPQPDALTNSEAFLASIASCGVTLVEGRAQDTGVPVRHMSVAIEAARHPAEARFRSVALRFEIAGVSQSEADRLVEAYRRH